MSHATPLEALYQVYRALRANREEYGLVMEDRQEYRWVLGDDKQIETIEPYEKLLSQKLVEECMIAANRCGARFLTEHGASGPFVGHRGFRADRLSETRKFLEMHAAELASENPETVARYRTIMRGLSKTEHELPQRPMVNRLLSRAELCCEPLPHMGMALESYTNCTSPLRKYLDFLVHLQIKAVLHGETANLVAAETLEQLSGRLAQSRAATLEAERWLASNYLAKLAAAEEDARFEGRVIHVNSSGFNVRLDDNGLEGFVDLRKDPEKFSYDKWTASLTSTTRRFRLEQPVTVSYLGAAAEDLYQARFALVEGCGLKPQKEEPAKPEKADDSACLLYTSDAADDTQFV